MEWEDIVKPSFKRDDAVNPLEQKQTIVQVINPLLKVHEKAKYSYIDVKYNGKDMHLKLGASVLRDYIKAYIDNGKIKSSTWLKIDDLGIPAGWKAHDWKVQISDGLGEAETVTKSEVNQGVFCIECRRAYYGKELVAHAIAEKTHKLVDMR